MPRPKQPPALRPNDLAVIGVGLTIFGLALGGLVGVGLASVLFGDGWAWPAGVDGAAHELGGLLTGRPGHGLEADVARRLPGHVALWVVVVLVELLVLAAGILFARWAGQVVRPEPARGAGPGASRLASKEEVAAALGRRRHPLRRAAGAVLRKVAPQIPTPAAPAGWPLGRAHRIDLWVPYDRTVGVIGPATSGKTLDVVAHAVLAAPGAVVQVATKPDDVLLTLARRGEPVAVFDPLGRLPGLPPLAWDPLHGCVDSTVATRRAKAFTAGTVLGAASDGGNDAVARANAAEAAKVLQCYLHAAALTGRTIDHVLSWVADPVAGDVPETILREHPHAESHWADLLRNALREPPTATLQQAMDALLHKEIAQRCLPSAGHPATDVADLLARSGTIYLLGSDDPVVSVSPLLTAVADDLLDIAPPGTVAVLDDLTSVPVPTLPPGVVWTAPSRQRLATCYGDDTARAIVNGTAVLVYLGGAATKELTKLGVDRPLRPGEALVVAGAGAPSIVALRRVVAGKPGAELLADLEGARARATASPETSWHARRDPARSALAAAHERGLHADTWRQP